MRIVLFDTLKAKQQLVDAGVPEAQAIAQVSVLAEVASLHPDDIATKDYIDERLLSLEARLSRGRL